MMKPAEDRKRDDISVNVADSSRFGNGYCLPQILMWSGAVKVNLAVLFQNTPQLLLAEYCHVVETLPAHRCGYQKPNPNSNDAWHRLRFLHHMSARKRSRSQRYPSVNDYMRDRERAQLSTTKAKVTVRVIRAEPQAARRRYS